MSSLISNTVTSAAYGSSRRSSFAIVYRTV